MTILLRLKLVCSNGVRQPGLLILAAYAKAANVYVEALITDDIDLPRSLPAVTKTGGN
jgi:hypothetical protein